MAGSLQIGCVGNFYGDGWESIELSNIEKWKHNINMYGFIGLGAWYARAGSGYVEVMCQTYWLACSSFVNIG